MGQDGRIEPTAITPEALEVGGGVTQGFGISTATKQHGQRQDRNVVHTEHEPAQASMHLLKMSKLIRAASACLMPQVCKVVRKFFALCRCQPLHLNLEP